jgi:hypothetical protein
MCFKIEQKQSPKKGSEQWIKREMPMMGTKVRKDVMQNMGGDWGDATLGRQKYT